MRMRHIFLISISLLIVLVIANAATAQTEPKFHRWVIGRGGGQASGPHVNMVSTFGQPIAGNSEGTGVSICNGFWCGEPLVTTYYIYLPATLRNYVDYFEGPWEAEPNDSAAQANGPIISGQTYNGTMSSSNDANDYFSFSLSKPANVILDLTNIPSGCDYDLTLRNESLDTVRHSGEIGNKDEHINTSLDAGIYYIQIHNTGQTGSNETYHLTASYD